MSKTLRHFKHNNLNNLHNLSFQTTDLEKYKNSERKALDLETQCRWADAFILVYSVTDKCSFDECNRLKFLINYNKRRRKLTNKVIRVGGMPYTLLSCD